MKILHATIKNFLTIGEAKLELDNRGLLLIVGDNADDSSASSNGAGKSSLVDAICWALYGSTARDVSGDDVINETAKKDCYVHLHIEDGGKIYNITRHRKHKLFKNSLIVSTIDSSGKEIDLSRGTDKETQGVIIDIVGCSADVFTSAVYAGQEKMPDLPSMTDKTLKVLIEEAAGIQVLEEAHAIAKKRLGESKDAANVELGKITVLENAIANTAETIANAKAKATEFDDGKRDRARAHIGTATPYVEMLKTNKAHDVEAVKNSISKMRTKLAGFDSVEAERQKLNKELITHKEAQARLSTLYSSTADRVKKTLAEIQGVEKLEGTPCKECGKEYCGEDLHEAVNIRRASVDEGKKTLATIKAEHAENAKVVADVEAQIAKLQDKLQDKVDLEAKIRRFETQARDMQAENDKLDRAKEAVERIKGEAKAMMTQDNPFIAQISELEAKKAKYEAQKAAQQAIVEKAVSNVRLHEDAVRIYGPAGVRAHILDTVTPFLNARTNDYLGALSDGNAHATWTTLSSTAKGETKEKFSIAVSTDTGGSSFKKLSGGEKRKVRLATAMALQDLVASRATKPIQIFIADEIDYALDDNGLERLMTLLERKARERGTVLIISHQSGLRDWCDQVITVKKEEGYSTVSGDNLRVAVAA